MEQFCVSVNCRPNRRHWLWRSQRQRRVWTALSKASHRQKRVCIFFPCFCFLLSHFLPPPHPPLYCQSLCHWQSLHSSYFHIYYFKFQCVNVIPPPSPTSCVSVSLCHFLSRKYFSACLFCVYYIYVITFSEWDFCSVLFQQISNRCKFSCLLHLPKKYTEEKRYCKATTYTFSSLQSSFPSLWHAGLV